MKAFRIKKKSHRQPTYIIGPSVTSFPKPKLPLILIKKINQPTFKPKFIFEVDQPEVGSEVGSEVAVGRFEHLPLAIELPV